MLQSLSQAQETPAMTTDDAFVRAILADPGDDALRLVYSDWLDERADARGPYLRLLCRLSGACPPPAEEVAPLLDHLERLRSAIDPAWVGLMHRGRSLPVADPPPVRLYQGPDNVAEAMARD